VGDYALERGRPPGNRLEREWLAHARELRGRLAALHARGELVFPPSPRRPSSRETASALDLDSTTSVLLSSYIHMTNNRLGVSILDESYLAHLLSRAVAERAEGLAS
jgi:hypothetical protein